MTLGAIIGSAFLNGACFVFMLENLIKDTSYGWLSVFPFIGTLALTYYNVYGYKKTVKQ